MNVIVDTSIWSGVLRRPRRRDEGFRRDLEELIEEGRVVMLGPVRQELLSGLKTDAQFEKLRAALEPFPDHNLVREDFEEAAACFNRCRRQGIQGSNTDFLICAVALRHDLRIFTTDQDFDHFRKALRFKLYEARFEEA